MTSPRLAGGAGAAAVRSRRVAGAACVAASAFAVLALPGCASGSGHPLAGTSGTASVTSPAPPSSPPAPTATTVAGQLPTAFDCGGGAYEPATLIVVCGVGSTTVTGSRWTSWTAGTARGTGTVNLPGKLPSPATLALDGVVQTVDGPEFSRLTVTWTASSPTGRPEQVFRLATAAAGQ